MNWLTLWQEMRLAAHLSHVTSQVNHGFEIFGQWIVSIYEFYVYCDSFADERLREWPLMGTPLKPLILLLFYLTFVYYGCQYMTQPVKGHQKSKKEGHLFSSVLVMYNLSMAVLNAWISYELLYCGLKRSYNFLCQLVYTKSDDPYENRIAYAIWWYFASKGFELLDTVFIVYKRKVNQLTFLHIYHHSTMFAVWWVGSKYVPGGSTLTAALVNSVVHILMYTYYALSAVGPKMQPYLWWKKYLTIIQLIQFTAGVTLGLNSIISNCNFTRWMQYVFVCYAFSFLILFGKFYHRTYAGGAILEKQHLKISSKIKETIQMAIDAKHEEKRSGKRTKQSKLTMLKAKHNYGSMARRRKVVKNE